MNHSTMTFENKISSLPFEPTQDFFSDVNTFAEESKMMHLDKFDRFFDLSSKFTPNFFFQRLAFGAPLTDEPTFFASSFHFRVDEKQFSFFLPTFPFECFVK